MRRVPCSASIDLAFPSMFASAIAALQHALGLRASTIAALASLWLALVLTCFRFFIAPSGNAAQLVAATDRRRKTQLEIVRNCVHFENERLKAAAAAVSSAERCSDDPDGESKQDRDAADADAADAADADAADADDNVATDADDNVATDADELAALDGRQLLEADHKTPPTAEKLFKIIFDEVEEEDLTGAIGVAAADPFFLRVVTMFKAAVRRELDEACEKTVAAQKLRVRVALHACASGITTEEQDILDYADGVKLAKLLLFVREKAVRFFKHHTAVPTPAAPTATAAATATATATATAATATAGATARVSKKGGAARALEHNLKESEAGATLAGHSFFHFDAEYLVPGDATVGRMVTKGDVARAEKVLRDVRDQQKR